MSVSKYSHASVLALFLGVSGLVGCGSSFDSVPSAVTTQGSAIQGQVMGGQQPIVGAKIYLMQANPIVWKGPSTSLLTAAGNTLQDANGNYYVTTAAPGGTFNISGDYTCTTGTQVYLIGVGGNSLGTSTSVSNSAIVQMALLARCPNSGSLAKSIPFISMNEVSTVVAAYSIAGYALDSMHIGQYGTAAQTTGLANAFLSAGNLVSLGTGTAYSATPAGNGIVPQTKINTLADIIATCVNTKLNTSSACTTLFNATPNAAGVKPATTFDAILNLAQNPVINATNTGLINQPSAVSPFQPYFSANPNDWTVSVQYSAPNSNNPAVPDVDSQGNVWIPNLGGNSLTELSTLGAVLSGTAGFTGGGLSQPAVIAVNRASDKVWVANYNSGTISAFIGGAAVSGSPYTTGNSPANNVFMNGSAVLAPGSSGIFQLSDAGVSTKLTGIVKNNTGAVLSPAGDIWSAQNANSLAKTVISSGVTTTYIGGGLNVPGDLAMDFNGNAWASNVGSNAASQFNYQGIATAANGYTGGGLVKSQAVVIDGYNQAWFSNANGSLAAFTAAGKALTGTNGYTTPSTTSYNANSGANTNGFPSYGLIGLVIDQSGNLWAPDFDGNIYEFVGLAAPPVPVVQTLQIACGSNGTTYPSSAGQTWVTDTSYISLASDINTPYTEPGNATATAAYNNQNPAPSGVYLNERIASGGGAFTERIPGLTAGNSYNVNLHFAELYYGNLGHGGGVGTRVFNVSINGTKVLTNFDIYAEAGASNVGIVRSFTAIANANGIINVNFASTGADNAKCDGIEIVQN